MQIKSGFVLREFAGNHIVVSVGARVKEFNGVINLNETGVFLWKMLETGASEQELCTALVKEYGIAEETAKTDVSEFVNKIKEADLLK